jgi:hypothetical protein
MSDLTHEPTVRKFLKLLHSRAAAALSHLRRPGVVQTVSASPDDRGVAFAVFAIGDVDRMAEAVLIDARNGRNTYIETRSTRPGRPKERRSGRGKADATIGTFAICIDSDSDRGRAAHIDGGATVVETSPGNQHLWLFLERALNANDAERLGKLVRKSAGGDHCSGVVTQPFRIPGTPNYYSNAKKRARNGVVAVPTKLIAVSDKLWTPSEIEAVFSTDKTQAAKPQPIRKVAGALKATAPTPSARHRARVAKAKILSKVNSKTDRSAAFQPAVNAAARAGMSRDQVEAEMRDNPSGPQQKYISEGTDRLRAEIDRSYAKVEQQLAEEQAQRDTEHAERVEAGKGINGGELLDQVYQFIGQFVVYPDRHAQVAHALWVAHTHFIDRFETTPRLAFISPEPASGKTRALEITEPLVPNPVLAVNVSPAYLIRKVAAEEGVTILFDEIDTVFGKRPKESNEDVRALLNAGYRRGAVSGRVVMQGATAIPEELSAFAPVALAGLGTLPDTILTRSIVIHMRRRAPNERVTPYRRRDNAREGERLCGQLAAWAAAVADRITVPDMPDGITDRDADCWEALFAVADAAGEHWPDTARVAGVSSVLALQGERDQRHGIRLLSDLRKIFGDDNYKLTSAILQALTEVDESPWADIRGKPLSDVGLAARLRPYGIKPKTIRIGDTTPRGYWREHFEDAWRRYCRPVGEDQNT